MDDIKNLKRCFKTFRKLEMKIWDDEDYVKMNIPLNSEFMLVIKARFFVQRNGKSMIRISDDGVIAKDNALTFEDIRALCERYHLEFSITGDKEAIPFDWEIYKIVDEEDFCDGIWKIIEVAEDACRLEHKRTVETTNMMNKIREALGLKVGEHFKINDTDCWFDGKEFRADTAYPEKQALLFYRWLSGEAHIRRQEKVSNNDKMPEKREQENKPSKIIHDLTITIDEETLKDWRNPTGFMDGGYKAVWGEFDNYLTVRVKPSMTLEGDGFTEVCLCKDGKEVASTYPYFLFVDPICLEYNGEEYHIQLKKECKEKRPELEDYF